MHVCSRCKSMTYCNEACQRKAWKGWHKKECAMLSSLKKDEGATPTPTLMMTFRTLVKCASDLQGGFLGELVHHLDTMPQDRRDMYAQLAVLLNSMCRRAGMPELSMQEALTLFAKLEVNSFSILDKTLTTTAYGVYRTASCVNHSCEPNMVAAFSGRDVYLRPIRDIEKGDELTISYVELAALTETRRVELQDRYGFKCACTRCTGAEGQKMERDLPPTLLAEGNVLVSDLIEKKEFTAALTKCMDLLPFMALYGVDLHPSVGMHWFNIAKLRWFLEDTDGTYEVCLGGWVSLRMAHCSLCCPTYMHAVHLHESHRRA